MFDVKTCAKVINKSHFSGIVNSKCNFPHDQYCDSSKIRIKDTHLNKLSLSGRVKFGFEKCGECFEVDIVFVPFEVNC